MPQKLQTKKAKLPPGSKSPSSTKLSPARKPDQPTRQKISRNHALLALLILVLLPALTFWPVLGHEFLNWDDPKNITGNPLIRSLTSQNLKAIFLDSAKISNYYIPLTFVSLSLDHALFGLDARAFHRTNLIFHIANGLLIFWFCYLLTGRQGMALLAAALFAVHPVQVEAVSWVTERKGLIASFFLLSSLLFYLRYLRFCAPSPLPSPPQKGARTNKVSYAAALFFFALSLLSKPTGLTLPFLLLLLDSYRGRPWHGRVFYEKVPFLALTMILGFISLSGQQAGGALGSREILSFDNLLYAAYSLVFYLAIFFSPANLSAFYPYPDSIPFVYLILTLGLISAVIYFRKQKDLFFGMAFFLLALLPVIKIVPFGNYIAADRLIYFPSVGLFFLIGRLWQRLRETRGGTPFFKKTALLLAAGILMIFVSLSRERLTVWHDSGILWEDVLRQHPRVALAHANLGAYYGEKNRLDDAIVQLREALALDPQYAKAHYNLAVAYLRKNESALALKHFERALALGYKFSPEILKMIESK